MPKLSVAQYAKILSQALKSAKKQDIAVVVNTFSDFVKKNHMMKKMPAIMNSFIALTKKQDGRKEVSVVSAFPVKELMRQNINSMFGGKAEISVSEDKSLMGGMILQTENTIFDASVRTQVQKMKENI